MAGFQQLRVNREVDFTGATKIGFGHYSPVGDVFYVHTGGADGNEGKDPTAPKLTIDSALSAAANDSDDYIIV